MPTIVREPILGCPGYTKSFLGLTQDDANLIKKPLQKALKIAKKRYEYFNGIHEIGEATDLQQTKMVEYQDDINCYTRILDEVDNYLRPPNESRIVIDELELLKTTAANGYPESQYRLGVIYNHGYGVDQDVSKAKELWEQAAEQGHEKAQDRLNN